MTCASSPGQQLTTDVKRRGDGAASPEGDALIPKQQTHAISTRTPSLSAKHQMLKWGSLCLLILQNSAAFVLMRYTRIYPKGRLYLSSAVVLVVELVKLPICLVLLLREASYSPAALGANLYQGLWVERRSTLLLGVPAVCYALQNNLIFVATSNLSAAASQVLYQLKTLSTALFTVALLGKSFKLPQWVSFGILMAGVVIVQSEDAKSSNAPTGSSPVLGVVSALTAATLSGFAGVFLEKMFTSGGTSLWLRNVQLALFSIPLQLVAIHQLDAAAVAKHGLLQGFKPSTWLLVAVQVGGALCIAVVIKFAGNVLKTFATSLALLVTCGWSMLLFDFVPTPFFAVGLLLTTFSIYLYARPDDITRLGVRCVRCVRRTPESAFVAPKGVFFADEPLTRVAPTEPPTSSAHDELVNRGTTRDARPPNGAPPTQLAACVVVMREGDGEWLHVSRGSDVSAWGLPGGKADAGETAVQAAVRELAEETGVAVAAEELTAVFTRLNGKFMSTAFVCRRRVPADAISEGMHSREGYVKWGPRELALQGPFAAYNEALIATMLAGGYLHP